MMSKIRFGLPENAIENMSKVFALHPEIDQVVLYGSRAMGNFKPGSDIDLTLVGDEIDLNLLLQVDNEIDDLLLPWMVDLSIFHNLENAELINHIETDGITIYKNEVKQTDE
jgi:uncharacterized protein